MSRSSWSMIILLCMLQAGLVWWSDDLSFFWDTIQLVSYDAHWFYEQGLFAWPLPEWMDSGNPPSTGWLLALLWMIFERSLSLSHWFMFPFLCINSVLIFLLFKRRLSDGPSMAFTLAWLIFPVYAGQSTLISPDILLMTAFLTWFYSRTQGSSRLQTVSLGFMTLISLRAMLLVAALFLAEWIYVYLRGGRIDWRQKIRAYLPSFLLISAFVILSLWSKGWFGMHSESPWIESVSWTGWRGFFRNIAVLAFRLVDYGFLVILALLAWFAYKRNLKQMLHRRATAVCLGYIGLFLPLYLFSENLIGHRYMLPLYFSLYLLFVEEMARLAFDHRKILLTGFVLIALFTASNRIIYPDKMAQGWDATLAYIPYDELRKKAIRKIDEKGIPLEEVGTWFPNRSPLKYLDLSHRTDQFSDYERQEIRYILYSNVFNDVPDSFYHELRSSWTTVFMLKKRGIEVTLYEKPGK